MRRKICLRTLRLSSSRRRALSSPWTTPNLVKTAFQSDSSRRVSSAKSSRTPRIDEARCSTFIALPDNSATRFSSLKACPISCRRIGPDLGELVFLFGRDDRLRLVQCVGDEVVQLLPAFRLQNEQTELGFQRCISHRCPATLTNCRVSSSFGKLSIRRCVQGRVTVCTWLMIPSSK